MKKQKVLRIIAMNTVRKVKIITRITIIYINLTSDIFFGATSQHCEPKKISSPQNDLWGGLELYIRAILGGKSDNYMI